MENLEVDFKNLRSAAVLVPGQVVAGQIWKRRSSNRRRIILAKRAAKIVDDALTNAFDDGRERDVKSVVVIAAGNDGLIDDVISASILADEIVNYFGIDFSIGENIRQKNVCRVGGIMSEIAMTGFPISSGRKNGSKPAICCVKCSGTVRLAGLKLVVLS